MPMPEFSTQRIARLQPTNLVAQPVVAIHDYRPEIDGLRAVAVLAVIAHHFRQELLPGGFLGVDMFFVISGYVITASMLHRWQIESAGSLLDFFARRVKRLLPALVVCVLATALIGVTFISPQHPELRSSLTAGIASLFGVSNIYFFNEARDYFGTAIAHNLFTHTWSLGVEEQFYLLLPALFWVLGGSAQLMRGPRATALLLLMTVLSLAAFLTISPGFGGAYFLMPLRLWELSLGCLVALRFPSTCASLRDDKLTHWLTWAALGGIGLALGAPADLRFLTTPLVVFATAALIVSIRPCHPMFRALTTRPILLIGLMSYSLYLWHWSVLSISRWTWGVTLATAPWQIFAILLLGSASYFWLEAPLRRARWSKQPLTTIAMGLSATIASAGLLLSLNGKLGAALYTGMTQQMIAKGVKTLAHDKWDGDRLMWSPENCVLKSNSDVGKNLSEEGCTIAGRSMDTPRRLLVIGNSSSAAEFEMFAAVPESGLGDVILTSAWGASPVSEVPNNSAWSAANTYYWQYVIPRLMARLSAGDLVVIATDIQQMLPERLTDDDKSRLRLLKDGLWRLSRDLKARGISIVFQALMPFIREARCSPDMAMTQWFHFGQAPNCRLYSREYSLTRRQPIMGLLAELTLENWNFHILDLFPTFCPGETCGLFDGNKVPLYREIFSTRVSKQTTWRDRLCLLS